MIEPPPIDSTTRRPRIGGITIMIVLAFVIGVALMWATMRGPVRWPGSAQPSSDPGPGSAQSVIASAPAPTAATAAPAQAMTLATREAALAAQIAALETRTATITADANTAAADAGRAEAILVAFASRRALDRGVGLGYLEEQLRQRFGATQPSATLSVIQASRDPVTLEELRQSLDRNASLLASGGDGWWDGLVREVRSLVVLRDAGSPSPLPGARLLRARRMLDAGQVEAALEEVDRLPGAGQSMQWRNAARRYVASRKALDTLESAAILGSMARPEVATPPPALN